MQENQGGGEGKGKAKRGKERTRVLYSLSVRSAGLRNSASLVFADFKMFTFLHQFSKVQQACLIVIYFRNLKCNLPLLPGFEASGVFGFV